MIYSHLNRLELDGGRKQYRKPLTSKRVSSAPSRSIFQLLLAHLHLITFMLLHPKLYGINPYRTKLIYIDHVLQQKQEPN